MEYKRDRQRNLIITIVVLALGLLASGLSWRAADNREQTRLQRELDLILERVEAQILSGMESRIVGLERMVDRWEASGGTPYLEWKADADNYRLDEPGTRAINWVDSNFIIRRASTTDDPGNIIGLDMSFEETRLRTMQIAKASHQPTFTEALDLVTDEKGIMLFSPIYIGPDDQFDGFILTVYYAQEILDTLVTEIPGLNIYVENRGVEIYSAADTAASQESLYLVASQIRLQNVFWDIRLAPSQSWVSAERGSMPEIVLVVGSFGSLLLALFVHAALTSSTTAQQLQRSQQRLAATFEALPDLVFILDKDLIYREILSADPAFLSVEASRLPGRKVTAVLPAESSEKVQMAVEQTLAGKAADRVEYQVPTPQGEFWFEGRAAKLHPGDPTSDLVVWIARDVTNRVRTREELARSNADLEQFAYLASHDLQEPLRKITTFSDRLDKQLPEDINPRARDYLARMRSAAQRMSSLINDLLTFSRISADRPPFAPVNLNRVMQAVVDDLGPAIEESSAQVDIADLPTIQGDEDQLHSLLQNLVGNAIKYRRPDLAPRIKVTADKTEFGQLDLRVADNGLGFNEKYLDQIFLPFKRLHSRSEVSGTGIGLAICQKIVQNHGGSISATSTEGEGSTFHVKLPQR